jgi:spore coat protein U-like protein
MSRRLRVALVLAALCLLPGTAAAQYCWVGMGNIEFGAVNGVGQPASTVNGLMNVNCNNANGWWNVRVCIALGAPVDMAYDPRRMAGSAGLRLDYNIYSDPSHTQIWGGEYSTAGKSVAVDVPIQYNGTGSRNVSYYAKVPVQNGARASFYSAHFSNDEAAVRAAGYNQSPPLCNPQMTIVSRFDFDVSASVWYDCTVSASPLDFGTVGANLVQGPVDATGAISVTCTLGAPYTISLDRGQGPSATVANRKLSRVGGPQTLDYQLYRDPTRNQPWGDGSLGTSTVGATGAGVNAPQVHTVYGRLARQAPPLSGTYNDTITVTVSY